MPDSLPPPIPRTINIEYAEILAEQPDLEFEEIQKLLLMCPDAVIQKYLQDFHPNHASTVIHLYLDGNNQNSMYTIAHFLIHSQGRFSEKIVPTICTCLDGFCLVDAIVDFQWKQSLSDFLTRFLHQFCAIALILSAKNEQLDSDIVDTMGNSYISLLETLYTTPSKEFLLLSLLKWLDLDNDLMFPFSSQHLSRLENLMDDFFDRNAVSNLKRQSLMFPLMKNLVARKTPLLAPATICKIFNRALTLIQTNFSGTFLDYYLRTAIHCAIIDKSLAPKISSNLLFLVGPSSLPRYFSIKGNHGSHLYHTVLRTMDIFSSHYPEHTLTILTSLKGSLIKFLNGQENGPDEYSPSFTSEYFDLSFQYFHTLIRREFVKQELDQDILILCRQLLNEFTLQWNRLCAIQSRKSSSQDDNQLKILEKRCISYITMFGTLIASVQSEQIADIFVSNLLVKIGYPLQTTDLALLRTLSTIAPFFATRDTIATLISLTKKLSQDPSYPHAGPHIAELSNFFRQIISGLTSSNTRRDLFKRLLILFIQLSKTANTIQSASAQTLNKLFPVLELLSTDIPLQQVLLPSYSNFESLRSVWFLIVIFFVIFRDDSKGENNEEQQCLLRFASKIPPLVIGQTHFYMKINLELESKVQQYSWTNNIAFIRQKFVQLVPGAGQQARTLLLPQLLYLLSVYYLETMRATSLEFRTLFVYISNIYNPTNISEHSISVAFKISLRAISDEVFDKFLSALTTIKEEKKKLQLLSECAQFLIVNFCNSVEEVRQAADFYISQIANRFPEILWNKHCLSTLFELLDVVGKGLELSPADPTHVALPNTPYHVDLSEDPNQKTKLLLNVAELCGVWLKAGSTVAPMETDSMLQEYIQSFEDLFTKKFGHMGFNFVIQHATNPTLDPKKPDSPSSLLLKIANGPGSRFINYLELKSRSMSQVKSLLFVHDNGWGSTFGKSLLDTFEQMGDLAKPLFQSCALLIVNHFKVGTLQQNIQSLLLHSIASVPVYHFTPRAINLGVLAWTWLFVQCPSLEDALMSEIAHVWVSTIEHRIGLFSDSPRLPSPLLIRTEDKNENKGVRKKKFGTSLIHVDNVEPHGVLLSFLQERITVHQIGRSHASSTTFADIITHMLKMALSTDHLSSAPHSVGVRFQLVLLCLRLLHSGHFKQQPLQEMLFRQRTFLAAVSWFAGNPTWFEPLRFESGHRETVVMTVKSMIDVCKLLASDTLFLPKTQPIKNKERKRTLTTSAIYPEAIGAEASNEWNFGDNNQNLENMDSIPNFEQHIASLDSVRKLLLLLLGDEIGRIVIWHNPLNRISLQIPEEDKYSFEKLPPHLKMNWNKYIEIAWAIDPKIALSVGHRFHNTQVHTALSRLIIKHPTQALDCADALTYLITEENVKKDIPELQYLLYWAPVEPPRAISFFHKRYHSHPLVVRYACRVLHMFNEETIILYLGQLVQCLRYESSGMLEDFLVEAAGQNEVLAHQLIWNFQTYIPDPLFPNTKLNADFAKKAEHVRARIIENFSPTERDNYDHENMFFESFTDISGRLVPFPQNQRKAELKAQLRQVLGQFHKQKKENNIMSNLYLPTDPNHLVVDIDIESASPLPSAEKVPILVNFHLTDRPPEDNSKQFIQGCIFKCGDDIRQDMLAVQTISLFKRIFDAVGLDLYLFPYKIIATKPECGIIEMVPKTMSRDALGKKTEGDMCDYFLRKYGARNTTSFQRARRNFIQSMAAYSVVSFILQVKDRHNGNILLDEDGHIIHIDFGFLFDSSPGGNIGFEKSPFKLTAEMIDIMGGSPSSEQFLWFMELGIRAFLASREYYDSIINLTELMVDTNLPCFFDKSIINLTNRFVPGNNIVSAGRFFAGVMVEAFSTKGTFFTYLYDKYQQIDNGYDM